MYIQRQGKGGLLVLCGVYSLMGVSIRDTGHESLPLIVAQAGNTLLCGQGHMTHDYFFCCKSFCLNIRTTILKEHSVQFHLVFASNSISPIVPLLYCIPIPWRFYFPYEIHFI